MVSLRRFRPPVPYPRRRRAISRKRRGITPVVEGIRGRTYYFRRCKKVEASNIGSLPNEVLIEILVRLPADEIFDKVRFVCRNWYHIIYSDAFMDSHRENSNSDWGLLLSWGFPACNRNYVNHKPLFMCVKKGRIELSKLNYDIFGSFRSSCNGLVLSTDSRSNPYKIHFVNLATKQAFCSPRLCPFNVDYCAFGLAYAAASMEYKVVRTYTPWSSTSIRCHILTLGVDKKWRRVGVDDLSCGAKKVLFRNPLITPGFMHWTWYREGTRVLTLNVETEMFTESYAPLLPHPVDDIHGFAHRERRRSKFYVSTGRRLCLFSLCGDSVWEVWEMEGESGEWIKYLPNIDLEAHTQRVRNELPCKKHAGMDRHMFPCAYRRGRLEPLGWVKYPVLLALSYCSICMVFNLATDEIDFSIELPYPCSPHHALGHRNTLEWLR